MWQLITGLFVHLNILDLLFSLLSFMFAACMIEKEIGTIRMIYRFFTLGLITLTLFTVFCGITGINQISAGLWPIMFIDLVFLCMQNPN